MRVSTAGHSSVFSKVFKIYAEVFHEPTVTCVRFLVISGTCAKKLLEL